MYLNAGSFKTWAPRKGSFFLCVPKRLGVNPADEEKTLSAFSVCLFVFGGRRPFFFLNAGAESIYIFFGKKKQPCHHKNFPKKMIPGKGLLIMKNTQFPYGLCVSKSGFLVFAEFLLAAGGNLLEMDWTMKFLFEFDRGSGRTIPTKNGICTISVANVSIGAHHHKNSRPLTRGLRGETSTLSYGCFQK